MKKPFISIIIPALNEEKYLPKLLGDLRRQRYKDFEVIVIDGNSEDRTREVAESFSKDLNIMVINAHRRNLSFQRNLGGENAGGKFLVFIDADSRVRPAFTYYLQKEINKCKHLVLLPTIIPDKGSQTDKVWFALINFLTEMSQSVGKPAPSIGCMVFEKGFFNFLEGYYVHENQDKKTFFPEDHDIILRAKKCGVTAQFMKTVKVGFSLRRARKEGRLSLITKYMRSAIHMSFKGKVDNKMFEYEMGGQSYNKGKKYKSRLNSAELNDMLTQFKSAFRELLKEK